MIGWQVRFDASARGGSTWVRIYARPSWPAPAVLKPDPPSATGKGSCLPLPPLLPSDGGGLWLAGRAAVASSCLRDR